MAFGMVPNGFEKYGGGGEAWTLPIDARTRILIDFLWLPLISGGFEGLGGWGRLAHCQLMPGHVFSLIFIDFTRIWGLGRVGGGLHIAKWCQDMYSHSISLNFIDFQWFFIDFRRIWGYPGQKVGRPVAGCGNLWRICPTPFRMLQSVSCTLQYR